MPSQCRYLKFKNEVQLQKSGQLNEVENPAWLLAVCVSWHISGVFLMWRISGFSSYTSLGS